MAKTEADLSDGQRRMIRVLMDAAGCFKCSALTVVRGRNCNSYRCQLGGCEAIRQADEIATMMAKGYKQAMEEGKCPSPPSGS